MTAALHRNRRVLVVDDTPGIHEDFRKILGAGSSTRSSVADARAAFLGRSSEPAAAHEGFELTSAHQGQEALELVRAAREAGEPFALAFVDVRMPPGWDGVETIRELWKIDEDLQCVICTAYSDYSWEETIGMLGQSERLLILKKPFDPVEIRQLASALTDKWNTAARERSAMAELAAKEAEARAYASSLETLNQALATSKASADRAAERKSAFLLQLTEDVHSHLRGIIDGLESAGTTEGVEDALDCSLRLLETVGKVMDYTGLEGRADLAREEPCDLAEVLRTLLGAHRDRARAKGLTIDLDVEGRVPDRIVTDGELVARALGHMVDNAVKYTESGRILVRVTTEPTADWNRARVRFDVEDTGAGVPAEKIGDLFEPFAGRETAARSSGAPQGTGLGLAIARQVARVLGGDLSYLSVPGQGCTFSLCLEAKVASGAATLDVGEV